MESQKTEHNTIEKENNAEKIYKIIEELMNYKNLLSEYDLKNDYEKYANLKTKYEAKKDEFLEMIENTSLKPKIEVSEDEINFEEIGKIINIENVDKEIGYFDFLVSTYPHLAIIGCGNTGSKIVSKYYTNKHYDTKIMAIYTDSELIENIKADKKLTLNENHINLLSNNNDNKWKDYYIKECFSTIEQFIKPASECSPYNMDNYALNMEDFNIYYYNAKRLLDSKNIPYNNKSLEKYIYENRWSKLCEEYAIDRGVVLIVYSLKDKTGRVLAPIIAKMSKKIGALTIALIDTSLIIDEKNVNNAIKDLEELKKTVDTIITLPCDKLLGINAKPPLNKSFENIEETMMITLRSMEQLIKSDDINIGFGNIKKILKNNNISTVHIYESDSENRTKEIIKDMESLFDKNGDKIAGVLVYIDAPDDLTIDEVNEIISTVRKKLNDNAMVIWSAKVNDENNSMKLTILDNSNE